MRKSLYLKFIGMTIAIMLLSSIISFVLSNMYYQEVLKPANDAKIERIATEIADYVKTNPSIDTEAYFEHIASIGYEMALFSSVDAVHYYGAPFREKSISQQTVKDVLQGKTYHGIAQFPHKTFVTGFFANEVENTIGVPLTADGQSNALFVRPDISLLFREMHVLFAWILGLSILISMILVFISTKFLVSPISTLTNATKQVAQGQFAIHLPIHRQDELGQLARSFTKMAEQLATVDEERKQFISNVSHDIQSPLSNIQGYVQLLQSNRSSLEEKKDAGRIIQEEIKRLSNLTKQLLLLSTLDQKQFALTYERFSVDEQWKQLIRNYRWKFDEKDIMIRYSLPHTIVEGDRELLYSVWENVLTNAIKYNQSNGEIFVELKRENTEILIKVHDTGIGMTAEEIDQMTERFYRADKARSRSISGTGLGMSIVSKIVHLHHGELHVESSLSKGTTITIKMPGTLSTS